MIELKNKTKLTLTRGVDGDESQYIEFYASVYNQESKPFNCPSDNKQTIEIINAGAFETVINSPALDCVAVLFHDKTKILGRSKSGTLQLISDDYGLMARVLIGGTQLHRDTVEMIERGDYFECSFQASTDDYDHQQSGQTRIRTINNFNVLQDVSIVESGQYANTNISMIREEKQDEKIVENQVEKVVENEVVEDEKIDESETNEKVETPENNDELEDKTVEKIENSDEPAGEEKEDKPVEVIAEKEDEPVEETVKNNDDSTPEKDDESVEVKRNKNNNVINNQEKMKTNLELFREKLENKQAGTITINRANETTTTSSANAIPKGVGELSIQGKSLAWEKLGADFHPNAKGTIMLPYKSPAVGAKVAELAAITKDAITASGNLLTPERFGYTFDISVETLASTEDSYLQKLIEDGQKAAHRKFENALMEKVAAGATTQTGATAISYANFTALEGAVDSDGDVKFMSSRSEFFNAKKVIVDSGSGIFLVKKVDNTQGETVDGSEYIYSSNFTTTGATSYVVAGDFENGLAIADYDTTELIVDPYTLATQGIVRVTVNILMGSALKNPTVFVKTADLDAA